MKVATAGWCVKVPSSTAAGSTSSQPWICGVRLRGRVIARLFSNARRLVGPGGGARGARLRNPSAASAADARSAIGAQDEVGLGLDRQSKRQKTSQQCATRMKSAD